jgi:hypothetical protein
MFLIVGWLQTHVKLPGLNLRDYLLILDL